MAVFLRVSLLTQWTARGVFAMTLSMSAGAQAQE